MNVERCFYPAPAKLNLFLHVVGRRADGYHELQTVFRFLDYGDELEITPRADGQIVLVEPLPGVAPERDLCWRAARLLQAQMGGGLGADIRLIKRLPMGGGLGGGSSDAATVLMALNRIWGLGLSRKALQGLGLQLGADVPVFIHGQTVFAEGVGEIFQPLVLPPATYVVLIPPVAVPTQAVFSHPELTRDTARLTITPLTEGAWQDSRTRNDLEPLVTRLYPEVAAALDWLGQFGAARMTGSGACCFAAFAYREDAERVFASRPPGMHGFVADGLDQHPLFGIV
jgi:4-diphosphocytidyl-2-C-methyl-D-erythritol kinase